MPSLPGYLNALGEALGLAVAGCVADVRPGRYEAGRWIDPHTGRPDKRLTQTTCFNAGRLPDWGGNLLLLRPSELPHSRRAVPVPGSARPAWLGRAGPLGGCRIGSADWQGELLVGAQRVPGDRRVERFVSAWMSMHGTVRDMGAALLKVEIVEGNPVYRRGLVALLTEARMKVVSARPSFGDQWPWRADVLVIALEAMSEPAVGEAVTAVARLTPVLVLACEPDAMWPATGSPATLQAVHRDASVEDLLCAIRTVASGGSVAAAGGSGRILPAPPTDQLTAESVALSPREQQVLRQIAHGRTHSQIARALGISHHTVDTYVKRIRSKMDLGNKAELTRAAVLGGF
jgi:DNA-binding NarL/FixJ family response regulator